ncbi:MAG: helix-turn-helix domain-containing protein [Planctomycetota bacterium]|jgi:transposase
MRQPAAIKSWLSIEKMFQWLQDAPDESSYKRRMSIWLTHTGKLHANKVAKTLGVSTQAVWLWIRQYNARGPEGLKRRGRGGRRWGFLTTQQESELLKPFIRRARLGSPPKPAEIKQSIEQKLQRKVSAPYIYRLLHRHRWAEIIAQSRQYAPSEAVQDDFKKFSRPWLREV